MAVNIYGKLCFELMDKVQNITSERRTVTSIDVGFMVVSASSDRSSDFSLLCRHKMRFYSFLFVILSIYSVFARINDPYNILSVGKQATTQEIKRAYKQLVKEW